MKQLNGGCLCGAVALTLPDQLLYAAYCHCSQCRRFSGSVMSAFGGLPKSSLTITRGADHISHYAKSADTILAFCRTCGSSLYADKPRRGLVHLRLGILTEAPALTPQAHVFVHDKVPWFAIHDGLPQFETEPPARPPA